MPIFFKLQEVLEYRHRSRSSHLRDVKNGMCTTAINVGPNSVVWLTTELETLGSAVIAGKSKDEIRQLVRLLHRKRQVPQDTDSGGDR